MKNSIKAIAVIIVITFGLSIFMLSNRVGGWRAFVVLSPSMEPTITTGSLVLTKTINPNQLKPKDIITFIRPDKNHEFITHRVQKITYNGNLPIFKTKGDKNKSEDTWVLAGGGVVGKATYWIPHLGYLLSLTKTKIGIAIFILIPSFLIIYDELQQIISLIKKAPEKEPIQKLI